MPFTTIRIDSEVREQLKAHGRKGETYNEIIKRLLETANRYDTGEFRLKGAIGRPSDFG